ncbi:ABC transporter ATP-binding protein [Bosea minatitlanensis]|uniref:ABC transporter ATP-binding protein n=1 Tax=Bosea minatitlanensis TaxID=128782 RepID=A0ABW0F5X5_9HYPH|nr:ABC transporter ATP-binding protein [Bosea minatitlanensis]MCT4493764.1 ABC transporter ATP-binding protein [Bosea minatitlanensis]
MRVDAASEPPLLRLRDFSVSVQGGVPIVRGVELSVARGEAIGIVGESGCGKSITWLAALRLLGHGATTGGAALLEGRDLTGLSERELARVRGGRIALIFQDPSSALNPVQRIGTQLGEVLRLHRGLRGEAARREALRLLDRVGIADGPRRLRQYPHEFSGGMNQRVMIALALAGEPDLLVADEPTTALDATIQAQVLDLIRDLRRETGMALVLISHDIGVVGDLCDRIAVMYAGRIVETASTRDLLARPRHPYTQGLLAALPTLDGPRRRLTPIPGTVPAPADIPPGCAFAPRCPSAIARCGAELPELAFAAQDQRAACLRLAELPPPEAEADIAAAAARPLELPA